MVAAIVFTVYFAFLVSVAWVVHRSNKSTEELVVGNRSCNYWVTALSAHASDMSTWLMMGFPGVVYLYGMEQTGMAIGLVLGMFLNWQFVAPRLRAKTEAYDCLTLPSYFGVHYGESKGEVRIVAALLSVIFFTVYVSAGLIGLGRLAESLFGLYYYVGIGLAIGGIMVYTLIGGFLAVAWNDMFQALFLLVIIILVPVVAFFEHSDLTLRALFPAGKQGFSLKGVMLALDWGLGYFGMPHVLNKFMVINSVKAMNKAKYTGISWQILVLSAAIAVGLVGAALLPGLRNPELVFMELTQLLFDDWFSIIVLCAIVAAAVTTLDSQLIVAAGNLSQDCYSAIQEHFKGALKWNSERVYQVSMAMICLSASVIAWKNPVSIFKMAYIGWVGLGSTFGPLVLLSLVKIKVPARACVAGMLGGALMAMFCTVKGIPGMMLLGYAANLSMIFIVRAIKR